MTVERVELDSGDLDAVEAVLPSLVGKVVYFSNGCDYVLLEEAGCFWGDSPYGEVLCVEIKEGWPQRIVGTLRYWNEHDEQYRKDAVGSA